MRSVLIALLVTLSFSAPAKASDAAAVADRFYAAFAIHDWATMADLYADSDSAVFSDPVFQNLNSRETKGMWKMLVTSGHDLKVTYQIESATVEEVKVLWLAEYTFTATSKKVLNEVRANLRVQDGKIIGHNDHFDLCKWADQALGHIPGHLACYFPGVLRQQARARLDKFLADDSK